jgi:hypothetical protein
MPHMVFDTLPGRSFLFPCYPSKLTLAEKNLEEQYACEPQSSRAYSLIQNRFDQQKTGHSGLDPESRDCLRMLKKLADNPGTYGNYEISD